MKITRYILAFALIACASCNEKQEMPWDDDLKNKHDKPVLTEMGEAAVGEVLPRWSEGCLDIHLINNGNGECNFFILPDGTTLLVDAGECPTSDNSVARKPNSIIQPSQVFAYYIQYFLPAGKTEIDWCAPSHFHTDHIGTRNSSHGIAAGGYALSGLTAVYEEVPFRRLLDLGYPEYDEDKTNSAIDGEMVTGKEKDWQTFVKWAMENKGMEAGRFTPGQEQITLVNNKDKYENFSIFNFIGGTYAWYKKDGEGQLTHEGAGRDDLQGNPSSAGFHIRYGDFDFMTAGDLELKPQNALAYYFRDYVAPTSGIDVFKGNHHLNNGSWGSQMKNLFDPRVIVAHTLKTDVPNVVLVNDIMDNKYAAGWTEKDIFVTNVDDVMAKDEKNGGKAAVEKLGGYNGHIVVRVAPGGKSYNVYMLDDTNLDYKVKSVHGPYTCK